MLWVNGTSSVHQVHPKNYTFLLSLVYVSLILYLLNSEFLGLLSGPQATLNPNGTVTVEFELKTCQKHFAAVWLLLEDRRATPIVYNGMRNKRMDDPSSSILQVPKDCLTRRGNVFSLTWPSPARRSCSFPLIPLMECRVYSIEILPIFQGFQGQSQTVTFTVPPLVSVVVPGSDCLRSLNGLIY